MKRPGLQKPDLIAIVLLIALPTILFADVILGVQGLCYRDLTRYYYPTKRVVADVVRGHEFPYWNRTYSAGQPLAANPEHAVFYPGTWLTFLPNYDLGFRLHIVVHFYIALLAMYALLRSMRCRPTAAFFGAASFGLGGLLMSYVNLLPILFCAAWLPLTCLYTRRFLMGWQLRDFSLASLFFTLQLLAGEPTTIIQSGLLLGVYALHRACRSQHRLRSALRYVGGVALISIAAFAAAAVQLVPALDLIGDSVRSRSLPFELVSIWSMPPSRLGELVFPYLLGHVNLDGTLLWYWGANLYPRTGSPFLLTIYCGLAVAAFAAAGMVCRKKGAGMTAIVIGASALLATGSHTPILRALYDGGVLQTIRYPEKFILMAVFVSIVFAARMLDEAVRGEERLQEAAAGFALAVCVLAAVISAIGFTRWSIEGFNRAFGLVPGPSAIDMAGTAWNDWRAATLKALVLFVLIIMARTKWSRTWTVAAVAFLLADLWPGIAECNPRLPSRFFVERPPIAQVLPPQHSQYRIFPETIWQDDNPNTAPFKRLDNSAYWIARNGLLPMTSGGYGIQTVMERDYDKTALLPTVDFTASFLEARASGRADWWRPFMAMSNAWFRTVYRDYEAEKRRIGGNFEISAPVTVIAARRSPRYYFAEQMVPIADRADFVSKVVYGRYSDSSAFVAGPTYWPAKGSVLRFRETANTADIDVESAGRAFLVMSVTPHKYWHITIDGQPANPVITNIGFQGIHVAAGRHRVTMRYANPLVPAGGAVSLAAITALIIGASRSRLHEN